MITSNDVRVIDSIIKNLDKNAYQLQISDKDSQEILCNSINTTIGVLKKYLADNNIQYNGYSYEL